MKILAQNPKLVHTKLSEGHIVCSSNALTNTSCEVRAYIICSKTLRFCECVWLNTSTLTSKVGRSALEIAKAQLVAARSVDVCTCSAISRSLAQHKRGCVIRSYTLIELHSVALYTLIIGVYDLIL